MKTKNKNDAIPMVKLNEKNLNLTLEDLKLAIKLHKHL